MHTYTDGSTDQQMGHVGSAFVVPELKTMDRSLFLMIALQWVELGKPKKVVIFSDSSSILTSLKSKILQKCQDIYAKYVHVLLQYNQHQAERE